jgi:hypothetical protein
MSKKFQELTCRAGNHVWHRPAMRGKPPYNCPEHSSSRPATSSHIDAIESAQQLADRLTRQLAELAKRERSIIEH